LHLSSGSNKNHSFNLIQYIYLYNLLNIDGESQENKNQGMPGIEGL